MGGGGVHLESLREVGKIFDVFCSARKFQTHEYGASDRDIIAILYVVQVKGIDKIGVQRSARTKKIN